MALKFLKGGSTSGSSKDKGGDKDVSFFVKVTPKAPGAVDPKTKVEKGGTLPRNRQSAMPGSVGAGGQDIAAMTNERMKNDERILKEITSKPENTVCGDCGATEPRWVSLTIGVWLCNNCSEIHKDVLGKHLSDIKSMDIGTTTLWAPETIKNLTIMGNKRVNEKFEYNITNGFKKLTKAADRPAREAYIKAKYADLTFARPCKGVINVRVMVKKKTKWQPVFASVGADKVELYPVENQTTILEEIELKATNNVQVKLDVDKSELPSGKDQKVEPNTCFQVITADKQYIFSASSETEAEDWFASIRIVALRLRAERAREQLKQEELETQRQLAMFSGAIPGIGPSSPTTPAASTAAAATTEPKKEDSPATQPASASALTTGKKKLDSATLRDLLVKRTEEKEKERVQLRQQLNEINDTLQSAKDEKIDLSKTLEELEKVCSEMQSEQQSIQLKLCQLEPESHLLKGTKAAEDIDQSAGAGLVLSDDNSIKGGTVTKLVAMLTHEHHLDPEYLLAFLLTYRSFTTPADFLEKLQQRFQISPPPFIDDEDLKRFQETMQRPIRLRVFNVLKHWLTNHYYDFELDNQLVHSLIKFLDEVMEPAGMLSSAEQLRKLLRKKIKGATKQKQIMLDPERIPKPLHPVDIQNITFEEIDPKEVARQTCIIEQELYRAIRPRECLNQAWNHKTLKETAAPNILAMIRRLNRVAAFVTTTVVKCDNLKERAKKIERFITIAQHLRELHNYNAVQEILAGLTASPVHRLKKTWATMDPKLVEQFEVLKKLMSSDGNFEAFRTALHSESPPSIPYLGMYLTDLTFIEDGNPDKLADGLINFAKRRRIAAVILEIQQYQQTPYALQPIPTIINLLSGGLQGLDEKAAYNMSLMVEPRESK
eukprot:TRINITY_DN9920_c0_g1_i2.p1 TRINITY_DN9920_c0_g1~~TRINITY_DN9920_c0_g1_i2.p1  ORF type:complete len:887 (+),score=262.77 TRINITY_DN9920_c0_g1_i2:248-2908(+)